MAPKAANRLTIKTMKETVHKKALDQMRLHPMTVEDAFVITQPPKL